MSPDDKIADLFLRMPRPEHNTGFCHLTQAWLDWHDEMTSLVKYRDTPVAEPEPARLVVPVDLIERASSALGNFVSDHGWGAADMQVLSVLDAVKTVLRPSQVAQPLAPAPCTLTDQQVNEAVDKYGNPVDGNSLPFCCFPDCGCDGARLCMAQSGPSFAANSLNIERRSKP